MRLVNRNTKRVKQCLPYSARAAHLARKLCTGDDRNDEMTGHNTSPPRAFVFGNAAIDEILRVADLPAAGESVLGRAGSFGLGGKGANQAIALARTGVPTTLVTSVGADWHGSEIRRALSREPLEAVLIEYADLPSDRSIILTEESGTNVIVTTNECAGSISFAECISVLAEAGPGDAVLLQGNLRIDVTALLCRECSRRGLLLFLNPSPFDPALRDLLPLVDALFVNETEAKGLTSQSRQDAATALLHLGAGQVVLTLGAEGALLASTDRTVQVPAAPAAVRDVTGAGDCFEGVAIGSALLRDSRIDETAIRHASLAAAHTTASVGATRAFPSAEQIARLLADPLAT